MSTGNEPTWQQTAENLRETVRRLTAERDELRRHLTGVRSALALITVAIADDPDEGGQRK